MQVSNRDAAVVGKCCKLFTALETLWNPPFRFSLRCLNIQHFAFRMQPGTRFRSSRPLFNDDFSVMVKVDYFLHGLVCALYDAFKCSW